MGNGTINVSTLSAVPGQPSLRLQAGPAASWGRLRNAVQARFGWTPVLTDAYRDYATQERLFRQRYTTTYLAGRPSKVWQGKRWYLKSGYAAAATPGTSNHGLGTTVDVSGLGGYSGARFKQFSALASAHGWNNAEGRSINEAWHWTYVSTNDVNKTSSGGATTPTVPNVPTPSIPSAPKDWFDMASEQQLRDIVNAAVNTVNVKIDTLQGELGRIGQRLKEIDSADEVTRVAYLDYLGRQASANEVDNWVLTVVKTGVSAEQLRSSIAVSAEAFNARKARAAESYIVRLGRKASDAETTNWAKNAVTLAEIDQSIANSAEGKNFAKLPEAERAAKIAAARK